MGKKRKQIKHIPQRTCLVCRQKTDKRRLTRVVRTPDAGVVVDPTGKRNGRGAYLCDNAVCWDKLAGNVKLLNQTLLTEVSKSDLAVIVAHKPIATNHQAEAALNK